MRSIVGAIEEQMDAWISNIRDDRKKGHLAKKQWKHV
jgi:hypothetical protein